MKLFRFLKNLFIRPKRARVEFYYTPEFLEAFRRNCKTEEMEKIIPLPIHSGETIRMFSYKKDD